MQCNLIQNSEYKNWLSRVYRKNKNYIMIQTNEGAWLSYQIVSPKLLPKCYDFAIVLGPVESCHYAITSLSNKSYALIFLKGQVGLQRYTLEVYVMPLPNFCLG